MSASNPNARLEAFCDGVFAIALTLLIIDIKIPASTEIASTADLWIALQRLAPSIFAFLLSFVVILITWVNHHNHFTLIDKSCDSFLYANGFLLLTVVFIPFPTSLQGEYLLTEHAAPAVIVFNAVLAFQAIGWVLVSRTAVKNHLARNEAAERGIRANGRYGYMAFGLYALCAIIAAWAPHAMAIVTAITWAFWLIYGITMKQAKPA